MARRAFETWPDEQERTMTTVVDGTRARRRTHPLTPARVPDLPEPCRGCTLWEAGHLSLGGDVAAKQAWVRRVRSEWGPCGRVLEVEGVTVGYVSYAPPAALVGPSVVDVRNVSADAVCLAGWHVAPEARGAGLGKVLVQAAVKDLLPRRDVRAIEAFGWDGPGGGGCLTGVQQLSEVGFVVAQDHPRLPRMRLDLRRVVPTIPGAEEAWQRLRGAVGQWGVRQPERPRPAPETRTGRRAGDRTGGGPTGTAGVHRDRPAGSHPGRSPCGVYPRG